MTALPRTPSRSAIRSHALTASSTTLASIANGSGTGLHSRTAAAASSSPSARAMRAASAGSFTRSSRSTGASRARKNGSRQQA